jgi:hypothetical protein
MTVLIQSAVARDQNLNHSRGNPGGKLLDRGIELLQHSGRFCRPGSDCLCLICLIVAGLIDVRLCVFTACNGWSWRRHLLPKARRCQPQGAKARSQTKKRNTDLTSQSASWEEHSDTLLGNTPHRVSTQMTIMLEENKSVLLFRFGMPRPLEALVRLRDYQATASTILFPARPARRL